MQYQSSMQIFHSESESADLEVSESDVEVSESGGKGKFPNRRAWKFPNPTLKFPNPGGKASFRIRGPGSFRIRRGSFRIRGAASFRIRGPGSFRIRRWSFRIRGTASFRIRGPGSFQIRGPWSFRIRGPGSFRIRGGSEFPNPRAWKFPNPTLKFPNPGGKASFRIRGPGSFRIRRGSFQIRGAASFRIRGPGSFRIGRWSFRIRGTASFRIRGPGSFQIRGPWSFRIRGPGSFRIRRWSFRIWGAASFRIRGPGSFRIRCWSFRIRRWPFGDSLACAVPRSSEPHTPRSFFFVPTSYGHPTLSLSSDNFCDFGFSLLHYLWDKCVSLQVCNPCGFIFPIITIETNVSLHMFSKLPRYVTSCYIFVFLLSSQLAPCADCRWPPTVAGCRLGCLPSRTCAGPRFDLIPPRSK